MPAKSTSKKRPPKTSLFKRAIHLHSKEGLFIAFVLIFALLGGGYYVYRSFAMTISPTTLRVVVSGVPSATFEVSTTQSATHKSSSSQIGSCSQSGSQLEVRGTRNCNGLSIGPVSLNAPKLVGYTFKGWTGCAPLPRGGTAPSPDYYYRCNIDRFQNKTVTITAVYAFNPPCTAQNLSQGSGDGRCVTDMQTLLNYGLSNLQRNAVVENGVFDAKTQVAVQKWQTAQKITPVSGVVDSRTWSSLCKLSKAVVQGDVVRQAPSWVKTAAADAVCA